MKHLLLLFSVLLVAGLAQAQDDELPPSSKPRTRTEDALRPDDFQGFKPKKKIDLSKFIIEPNFNLSFGQGRIDFGIAPYVGYQVWAPKKNPAMGLYAGGGLTYFYTGFTGLQVVTVTGQVLGTTKANFHTYGGGVFLQYNIWRGFFARTRFEVLQRTMDDINQAPIPKNPNNFSDGFYFPKIQKTIPALLIGGGYNLLQSRNFFFPLMVSYNVLHNITDRTYSLYPRGLVVQLGFINIF